MTKEQPPGAPDMILQQSSAEVVKHGKRAMLLTAITVVSTAAACAHPVFALPALGAYIGAILEFRKVPSMNPPEEA